MYKGLRIKFGNLKFMLLGLLLMVGLYLLVVTQAGYSMTDSVIIAILVIGTFILTLAVITFLNRLFGTQVKRR
jgi:hypothetical protein